jgi:histidine triad (HIT) family protein
MTCALCAIADDEAPADVMFADSEVLAIAPLRMMAPVHVLLFPREHFDDLPVLLRTEPALAGRMMSVADALATEKGLGERGYRLSWNYGPDTAQIVLHPHLHLLGGRALSGSLA